MVLYPALPNLLPSTLTCIVTPGNRAAAVVAGLTVIVFILITVLDHREKIQKKRAGELNPAFASSETSAIVDDGSKKKVPLVDEEDVTPAVKDE